jgi:hypothetical protein
MMKILNGIININNFAFCGRIPAEEGVSGEDCSPAVPEISTEHLYANQVP